jgi:hypothetical protein
MIDITKVIGVGRTAGGIVPASTSYSMGILANVARHTDVADGATGQHWICLVEGATGRRIGHWNDILRPSTVHHIDELARLTCEKIHGHKKTLTGKKSGKAKK